MSKAKPLDQREHRIRPTVVDIGAYKKRDIPKLKGRYLKKHERMVGRLLEQ